MCVLTHLLFLSFTYLLTITGSENDNTVLELTYNWGEQTPYEKGGAYGHIAIQVDDVYKACESIAELGGKIIRPAGPMKGGSTVIAFVEDPDGYKVELLGPRDYNLDGIEGYVPGQCNK